MPLRLESLFPTLVGRGKLSGAAGFNRQLLREIQEFSAEDKMGREWSRDNYRGGYTSYASLNDLPYRSPVFARFAQRMQPHAEAFADEQGWTTRGLKLTMNACWMNIMNKHTSHPFHFHPHSVISGAYYVSVPPGSVALRLEDPRMMLYMHSPVRELYREITPSPGSFVLFESWLRHEVPPNRSSNPRVSLSFNYSLESEE